MKERKYKFLPQTLAGFAQFTQLALFHDRDGPHDFTSPFCRVYQRTEIMVGIAIIQSSDGRMLGSGFVSRGTFEKSLSTATVWLHTGEAKQEAAWIQTGACIQRVQVIEGPEDSSQPSIIIFTVGRAISR